MTFLNTDWWGENRKETARKEIENDIALYDLFA